ncbi:MAG: Asp-tRNA(Asn)/Glu-tRNA(Gln) amidotransferase subunit GatC [Flavisolibacter sp.]
MTVIRPWYEIGQKHPLQPDPLKISCYICYMHVDDGLIDKLSRLAMLQFNDQERLEIKSDLEKMIGFVDKLKELDTTGVEPLLHMSNNSDILREDIPGNMVSREEAFTNAPLHDEEYFKVPKVIKKPSQF